MGVWRKQSMPNFPKNEHFLPSDMHTKIRLISKFMTSQPGRQTIAIHILPYIPRSKENQTLKFGQLIECNMWKYTQNHTQNVLEKLVPNLFLKRQNWTYLWINNLNFYTVYLYCMPSWGLSKHIETKLQTTCFYFW